jgi:hypothetical protein
MPTYRAYSGPPGGGGTPDVTQNSNGDEPGWEGNKKSTQSPQGSTARSAATSLVQAYM